MSIEYWMIALLHTIGSTCVFGLLAVDVYVRQRDVFASLMRVVLFAFFLRYSLAIWYAAGYGTGWLSWTADRPTLFISGLGLYIAFFMADRHRWRHKRVPPMNEITRLDVETASTEAALEGTTP